MCQQGVLGDEKHIVFACPALQDLRDRYENLFRAPQGGAMILSCGRMTSLVLLGSLTHAPKECKHQLALLWGTRHLMSPELAGKDLMLILLLLDSQ